MRILGGTSGWQYTEWKGSFYPDDIARDDMLEYYAARFPAVEVNNTFYRLPKESVLAGWAERVPDGFSFVLKASRRITHNARIGESAAEPLDYLLATTAALGDRRGPLLFQLPPNLKKDTARLEAFTARLPAGTCAAFEFRHPSWIDDDILDLLRQRDLALCIASTGGDDDTPFHATAGYGYLRLRKEAYDDGELEEWADRVRAHAVDQSALKVPIVQGPGPAGAAGDDRADVAVVDLVEAHCLADRVAHRVLRHGNLQPNRLGRLVKPHDVLAEPEDLAAVAAQPLEDAVAIQQPVVEDADLGVCLRHKLAVDINLPRHN
jgi:uncharacterized protein YecE (DUF72 family)